MPSTYTQNLGLEMPADGEQAGTWGDTCNSNYVSLDDAINGSLSIALSASSYGLITSQGGQSQGQYPFIIWTGALTANSTVNISPNTAQKIYRMVNSTTGGFNVLFQQGTGGTFTLQPGYGAEIYCDGAGAAAKCAAVMPNPQFVNVLVTGALTVQGAVTYAQPQTFTQAVTFSGPVAMSVANIASLSVTTGTPATYDIYYRSATGILTPLPVGTPGQQLIVNSSGAVVWGLSQAQIGSVIVGSISNAIFFANAASALSQDANLAARAGVGIGLGVSPGHTLHVGIGLSPVIYLDSNAPQTQIRVLGYATNNAPRWQLLSSSEAESGGNAGSNIILASYNDAASATKTAFSAFRASGDVTAGAYADLGAQFAVANQNAGSPALIVRGAVNQSAVLQSWQNSAGTEVAHIDNSGNLFLAGGGLGLTLDAYGRLDLHGTLSGHPWGTIHIGPETGHYPSLNGSIAFENAVGFDIVPAGVCRIYYRNTVTPVLVIQYYYNGTQYFTSLQLTGVTGTWYCSTTQQ